MKISYNWLKDYVDFSHSPKELGDLLDSLGLGVDGITEISANWTSVVVGKVLTCEGIPESDHLSLCTVDVGTEENLAIVCGAPNVAAGQTVPVAVVGAMLPGDFRITKRKLIGAISEGMICSEKELGISDEASGIWILPDDLKIGEPFENVIGETDYVFDLEVTFNRPDCLCHIGVAREIAAATGKQVKLPDVTVSETDKEISSLISIDIQNAKRSPRYSARMIEGVKIKPSPVWMQQRLRAVGVRPINNVVDVTNYVLMETGHPLHAFDYHLVQDGKIIVRLAQEGEKFITLDEKEHKLKNTDLLIADPEGGIALAGVMGGFNSEIKEDTEDVLIECACFEPVGIRVTSRDQKLSTESSHRFERGVDSEMTPFASKRAVKLIQELGGGEILQGMADNYPLPWKPNRVQVRPQRVDKLLGTNIKRDQMIQYFSALGCKIHDQKSSQSTNTKRNSENTLDMFSQSESVSGNILVSAPSWRRDLDREIDYIEEVARLYGYEKIDTASQSKVALIPDIDREQERKNIELMRSTMVEVGFREVVTFSLISKSEVENFPCESEPLLIQNPISEDMAILRPSLCPLLLKVIKQNIRGGNQNIRLFEFGKCFELRDGKKHEQNYLSGVMTGNVAPASWIAEEEKLSIYELKGVLEQIYNKFMLDNIRFISYHIPKFLLLGGGIYADISGKETPVGWFGQILPEIADHFDIDAPVWYFELNGDLHLEILGAHPQFKELPKFPPAFRDLAFVVDEKVSAGEIEKMIHENGGEFLTDSIVFDLFRGGTLEENRKSLGFHLTFRSPVRTLSDKEVDQAVGNIVTAVKANVGAVLRSL